MVYENQNIHLMLHVKKEHGILNYVSTLRYTNCRLIDVLFKVFSSSAESTGKHIL